MRYPTNILSCPHGEIVPITPYICINDSQAMVKLAKDGLGIIKTHYPLVQELLKNEILIELLPSFIEKDVPLYVAFPQRRYVSSKVRSFIDFTLDKVKFQNG
jgi:DNA-binding transcriptional LysR family regulator